MNRVLIVDDNPDNLLLLRALFEGCGWAAEEARHGAEALVKARQHRPELVITDLLMPVMDGYTLLRHWKADGRLSATPFLICTASYTDARDEKLALDLGADAFIVKPIEPEMLMARVEEVLARNHARHLQPARSTAVDEKVVLSQYNELLIRKLNDKAAQLEQANRMLREKMAQRQHGEAEAVRQRDEAEAARAAVLSVLEDKQQSEMALIDSEARLRLALDAARMGIFDWDVRHNRIVGSHWHPALWGFKSGEFSVTYEAFADRIHRGDLAGINAELARCMAARQPFTREFRVVWPDGSIHWIVGRGEFTFDANGLPLRMSGVVVETTARKLAEEAVRKSERRLRDLIDGLGPSMFVGLMTPGGLLIEANRPALTAAGLKPEDVLGKPFEETYWWAYAKEVQQQLRQTIARAASGESSRYDVQVRVGENQFIIIDFSLQPLRDESGKVTFLVPSASVVTERKQAEEALRRSEASLAMAQTRAHLGSWELDLTTLRGTWSAELSRLHGRDLSLGAPTLEEFQELVHPEDRPNVLEVQANIPTLIEPLQHEYRTNPAHGPVRHLASTLHVIRDSAGRAVQAAGTTLDITEHKQAEQVIHGAHQRLQSLSRRLLEIQETERRALAKELHDEIGQALTAIKINLQSVQRFPDPGAVSFRLDESVAIVDRALRQVRSLSLELRPPLLDDLGLTAALRWLADQHASRVGHHMSLDMGLGDMRFGPAVEIACFRVAQEALTNVSKHAGARNVTVAVQASGGELHLMVRDDGAGFDTAAARDRAVRGASLGLLGMEERARLAGGGIEWRSAPGQGTEVHAWFALDGVNGNSGSGSTTP